MSKSNRLSEVLDDVLWHLTKPGSMQDPLNVRVDKAHKLISAQLIREKRAGLEKMYDRRGLIVNNTGTSYFVVKANTIKAEIADLTNQLKELEDE